MKMHLLLVVAAAFAGACGPRGEAAAPEFMARADSHAAIGRYEAASIEYRNAIKHAPSWADAHRKLGEVQELLGNADGAFTAYGEACRLAPADNATCLKAAGLLVASGLGQDAERIAGRVIDQSPLDVEAHIVLAGALEVQGRLVDAAALLERGIGIEPRPAAYAALGDIRHRQGDRVAAEAAFRAAVERAPASAEARVNLARFLSGDGRDAEAEEHLLEAVRLAPDDELANRALAALYIAANLPDQAEPYFKRAAAQPNPRHNSLLALADFYAGASRWEEARDVLDRAPREGAIARDAQIRLAAVQYETGSVETAHRTLEPMLQQKPSAPAWTLHALFLARERRFDAALQSARKAVAIDPDMRTAHLVIAAVERELGNESASEEAIQAAARAGN